MAQRFSGAYSPNQNGTSTPKQPRPASGVKGLTPRYGVRITLLSAVPLVMGMRAIFSDVSGLGLGLSAAALGIGSLFFLREGIKAQAEYNAREVAHRPAIPRKIFAALLWGISCVLSVMISGQMGAALVMGVMTAALFVAAFGLDPLKAKGLERVDERQFGRATRAIDQARAALKEMRSLLAPLKHRDVAQHFAQFAQTAEQMFERVYDDPRDLTSARRYLSLYLEGARDAARQYAKLALTAPSENATADFIALLQDLNDNFARKTENLIENDHQDLSIELEVLRDRLARERH